MWSAIVKIIGGIAVVALSFWATLLILDYLNFPPVGALPTKEATPDAQRKSDLHALQLALEAYFKTNGTYRVAGSGSGGSGMGWVNYAYPGFKTVAQVLHDGGYLAVGSLDDPMGKLSYMIYLCDDDKRYSISTTLDNPSPDDVSHVQKTCNAVGDNGTYTRYQKNYSVGN
jgi:hypothetical protein